MAEPKGADSRWVLSEGEAPRCGWHPHAFVVKEGQAQGSLDSRSSHLHGLGGRGLLDWQEQVYIGMTFQPDRPVLQCWHSADPFGAHQRPWQRWGLGHGPSHCKVRAAFSPHARGSSEGTSMPQRPLITHMPFCWRAVEPGDSDAKCLWVPAAAREPGSWPVVNNFFYKGPET